MPRTLKNNAMKQAFENMTGIPDSWTNPLFMPERNGFIQGWNEGINWLAQEHFDECREDRPIQNWIRSWAKV